jgi:hypothetical protein
MSGSHQPAATLAISRGPGVGKRFDLGAAPVTIGRHAQCDIQVEDTWMSRRHARIAWTGTEYIIEDLGSTNGTYVNGERIAAPRALKSGDLLQLGERVQLAFRARVPAPPQEAPVRPDVAPSPASRTGPPPAHAPQPQPVPVQKRSFLQRGKARVWGLALLGLVLILVVGGGAYYLLTGSSIEATIEAMPPPSPKLYLEKDTLSLSLPSQSTTTSHFGVSTITSDWTFDLGDQGLKETCGYSLIMASAGVSNVTVEFIVVQGAQENVIGEDAFTIKSDRYQPYRGQIAGSKVSVESGDQLILRLTVSGDNFGIVTGPASSIDVLENTTPLPDEVLDERTEALLWLATNNKDEFDPDASIFLGFKDRVDYVALSGQNATWLVGDLLTKSEKPYSLKWVDGAFSADEITLEEFQDSESWDRHGIVFELNP